MRPVLDIVMATRNRGKVRELRRICAVPGVRFRSLDQVDHPPHIRESGRTFEDNAVKKAVAVARAVHGLALADDSGLEVNALGGAPGIRSARFAGRQGNDEANNRKLLRLLEGYPASKRTARFRCVLVLASPEGVLAVTEGTLRGRVTTAPKGARGFGYDPLFLVPKLGRTTAELAAVQKNHISHRAQAGRRMRAALQRLVRHGFIPFVSPQQRNIPHRAQKV